MIVLDCNAAIAIIRNTPEGRALRTLQLEGERVIAPQFLGIEIAQTITKYISSGLLETAHAKTALSCAMNLVDNLYDDTDLIEEGLAEGIRLNHSVYDMLYFVLARRHSATLFTLDKKLQALCLANGVNCILLDNLETDTDARLDESITRDAPFTVYDPATQLSDTAT